MVINNCIDLYDYYIIKSLEERLSNKNIKDLKFLFSPSSLCFYYAKERFGERIFPFYNIWRDKAPELTSDASSLIHYSSTRIYANDEIDINFLFLIFSYQIDFFSNSMYDMNQFVFDYYKLKSSPYLDVNLNEIGLDCYYRSELTLDEIVVSNNIDAQFEKGRYFKYSFNISMRLMLIRKLEGLNYGKMNIKIIEMIENAYNLLYIK